MSLLIPWQVRLGAGLVAAGAFFYGGWQVEAWRAGATLDAEKLAHQADTAKLQSDWAKNMEAANERANKAEAQQQIDQENDRQARANAEKDYEQKLSKISASSAANAATAQRLRDDLAAAIAAGRISARSDSVPQAGSGASCSGGSGAAICGLLGRALDLASRCSADAERQHAAVTEAVGAWPKAGD